MSFYSSLMLKEALINHIFLFQVGSMGPDQSMTSSSVVVDQAPLQQSFSSFGPHPPPPPQFMSPGQQQQMQTSFVMGSQNSLQLGSSLQMSGAGDDNANSGFPDLDALFSDGDFKQDSKADELAQIDLDQVQNECFT